MDNPIITHPLANRAIGVTFLTGIGLIVAGALLGHTVTVIGSLCGTGSVLTLASLLAVASKIIYYFGQKREEEPTTPDGWKKYHGGKDHLKAAYIPNVATREDWERLQQQNPEFKVASSTIENGSKHVKGNVTFGDLLNRVERYNPNETL